MGVLSVQITTTLAQGSTTSIDWDARIDEMLANASALADKVGDDDVYAGMHRAVLVFFFLALIEIGICCSWRAGRAYDQLQQGANTLDARSIEMDQRPADGPAGEFVELMSDCEG